MKKPPVQPPGNWRNLRDERGKLLARIDPETKLLELRRNQRTYVIDLEEYIPSGQPEPKVLK